MESKQKGLLLRLVICAVANIVLLGLINFLGHATLSDFVVYKNVFSNVLVVFFAGLLICALWVFAYVCLDAIKREPVKNILLVFAFAVVMQFFFASALRFVAFNPYVALNGNYLWLFNFVCNALASLLAIVCVFKFLVFNFKEFDESVDALIYGGIAGAGIAFCDTLTTIFVFKSTSFDFVLLNFTVRASLFSCTAALASFLLCGASHGKKRLPKTILAYLAIVLLFGLSAYVEAKFSHGMFAQPYNRTLSAFVRTSIFCVAVFAVIVALIYVQLKKPFVAVENKITVVDVIVLALAFVLAVFVKTAPDKNEAFLSKEGAKEFSFELPFGFEEYQEKTFASIFENSASEEVEYVNRKNYFTRVRLDFNAEFDSDIERTGGWVVVSENSRAQENGVGYEYTFANSDDCVKMNINMQKADDAYVNKIVKTFVKTLEAK